MLAIWIILYVGLFLDGLLLTVIVPILPNFLPADSVGVVLSAKSIVKLFSTPFIGYLTLKSTERILKLGTLILVFVSLLYAFNQSVTTLILIRALHGIASTCIIVSGFSILASNPLYRNRIAYLLGASALGILTGHPFGSIVFESFGQKTVFLFITFLALCLYCFENIFVTFPQAKRKYYEISFRNVIEFFLNDSIILVIFGAIFISSLTTASLESTLPEWMLNWKLVPSEWQLGMVFLPDTFGYFLATNFFGFLFDNFIPKSFRWVAALSSMLILGFSACLLPITESLWSVVWPHFNIGFSIGILDAALIPLLAEVVLYNFNSDFGHFELIYSLQEIVISLAYVVGNIFSVEFVKVFNFRSLVRFIGLANIFYCPFLSILENRL